MHVVKTLLDLSETLLVLSTKQSYIFYSATVLVRESSGRQSSLYTRPLTKYTPIESYMHVGH